MLYFSNRDFHNKKFAERDRIFGPVNISIMKCLLRVMYYYTVLPRKMMNEKLLWLWKYLDEDCAVHLGLCKIFYKLCMKFCCLFVLLHCIEKSTHFVYVSCIFRTHRVCIYMYNTRYTIHDDIVYCVYNSGTVQVQYI